MIHSSDLGIGYINEEVEIVHEWFWVQERDLYHGGIKLVPEWDMCICGLGVMMKNHESV